MILEEEDIQQLRIRKTKGTGEQSFNLFSTSIAAFKVFHGRISNPNPFLMQHVAFILLCKISPSWITIYKLFLSYSNTWRDPQLERRGWLVGKGESGGGQLKGLSLNPCIPQSPGLQIIGGREKGR